MKLADVLIPALIVALVVLVLVLTWNKERLDNWSFNAGEKLGLRHPAAATVISVVAFSAIDVAFAWRAIAVLAADHGSSVVLALAGALLGLGGVGLWAYAHSRDYDVPGRIGRVLAIFSLLLGIAAVGAFTGGSTPLVVEVFCVSMVTTALLALTPLLVHGWRQGRRRPEMREVLGLRALTLLSGQRPGPRKDRHDHKGAK